MKKIIILIFLVVIIAIMIILFPIIYNNYIFPLWRLNNNIKNWDSYDNLYTIFNNYYLEYKNKDEIYFNYWIEKKEYTWHLWDKFLSLYHVNIFDDIQLSVYFDENNKVKEIIFIWD